MGQSRNGGNRREGEIFTNTRYRFSAAFQRLMILLYTLHQKSTWAVPTVLGDPGGRGQIVRRENLSLNERKK